jgi:NitT/TauT family transport system ATP-binding protein
MPMKTVPLGPVLTIPQTAPASLQPSSMFGLTRTLATLFPGQALPTLNGDALLSVQNVWKALGGEQILAGVSFDIRDRIVVGRRMGQIVGLLGPSGIGKTTLLRIIAALDRPDHGVVTGPFGFPVVAGCVGTVFQHSPLLRHRTVLGNLMVAGRVLGLSSTQAKARADQLLSRFRLAHRSGAYPAELSGGERQRAAIAQQIMLPRRLLLMDEPFSGLDPSAIEDVRAVLLETADADDANTILIVTHDIRTVLATADQVLALGRRPAGAGAIVRLSCDLVEHGYCRPGSREPAGDLRGLEAELRGLFREL